MTKQPRVGTRLDQLRANLEGLTGWLDLSEALILLGVTFVLLLGGLVLVFDAARDLIAVLTGGTFYEAFVGIAENALLALILVELVHTIKAPSEGGFLTAEPFLVIAIVATVRKMLLIPAVEAKPQEAGALLPPAIVELLALGALVFILGGALALLRMRRGRS